MLREELQAGLEIGGETVAVALKRHEDFGIASDAKEALAFAILGAEALRGVPNTVPGATGAHRAVIAGSLTRA
jgi:anhydro-N-acetylmuramic acid kinase